MAGAVGLLLIMVFMIAYYRLLGLVACIALVIYGVIFLGILNAIGVTMTLPGIAGIILTLGMAVDANVLIFARMRDEVAAGKTIGGGHERRFQEGLPRGLRLQHDHRHHRRRPLRHGHRRHQRASRSLWASA